MSLAMSPLNGVAWSLFLGLAVASASPPSTPAKIMLNTAACNRLSHSSTRSLPQPEQCVQIKGTEFKALEFLTWPICADGSTAELATFGPESHGCDPNVDDTLDLLSISDAYSCVDLKDVGNFSFWCSDDAETLPEPESDEVNTSRKDMTKEGGMLKYPKPRCNKRDKPEPEYHLPDTCVDITEGFGLSFTRPAVCANGTNALIAGFKGKGCDPTSKPLRDPFTKWSNFMAGFCVPTDEINSMTFWCDGLEGVDMQKPNAPKKAPSSSNLGLILGLSIGLGGLFVIIMGLVVAYNINYHFRMKVKELFGSGDGSSMHHKSTGSSQAPSGSKAGGHAKTATRPVTHMPPKLDAPYVSSSSSRPNPTHLPPHLDVPHSSSSSRHQHPTHLPSHLDARSSSSSSLNHRSATNLARDSRSPARNATNLHRDHANSHTPSAPPAGPGYTNPHDIEMASRQTRIESLPPHERKEQDEWVQSKLNLHSHVCPVGFLWDRIDGGYICQGGSHRVTDELLADGRGGLYVPGFPRRGSRRIPLRHGREWQGPKYPEDFQKMYTEIAALRANLLARGRPLYPHGHYGI
ncbi:uncharacterized protein BP5553_09427 [Venustampulla echinocandica]|uniref:Uncharacterized protein n=1 Tax=Venustampulla echinocandica TaxID=2656787 RepID=A0A370TCR8_9HELO|nr:uncharacterized protein BP5553_09427 [Venustampulla echinocandica]RDL32025.1 hypothetical protein BP5553_09427 [Venustampulla echinocandica]